MGTERYVIQGGVQGRERLRLLAEVMGPTTRALIDRVGIPAGASCLDLGCGGGDVTVELGHAAGESGRVLGVDLDATKVEIARREAGERGLANIAFEAHDIATWETDLQFDVVYARFLLTHLPDPGALLSAALRRLRPGGVIVVEDIDFRGHFSEPTCPALERYVELYSRAVERRGADPNIGPKLPRLVRQAGFERVEVAVVHPVGLEGGIKSLTTVTMEAIADALVRDGLASQAEVDRLTQELYLFERDPHTLLGGPRVFQVWARVRSLR